MIQCCCRYDCWYCWHMGFGSNILLSMINKDAYIVVSLQKLR